MLMEYTLGIDVDIRQQIMATTAPQAKSAG